MSTRLDSLGLAGRPSSTNLSNTFIKTVEAPVVAVASASEQDTGVLIPSDAVQLVSAVLDVDTAETTATVKTLTVGVFGGDADAFMTATSGAATGFAGVPVQVPVNGGGNIGYTLAGADFAELDARAVLTFLCKG